MAPKFCIKPGEGTLEDYIVRLGILLSRRGWSASKHQHTKEIRKALETLELLREEDIEQMIPIVAISCTPDDTPPRLRDCVRNLMEGLLREYTRMCRKYSPHMRTDIVNMIIEAIHRIATYPKTYEKLYNAFLAESSSESTQNRGEGGEKT